MGYGTPGYKFIELIWVQKAQKFPTQKAKTSNTAILIEVIINACANGRYWCPSPTGHLHLSYKGKCLPTGPTIPT